MQTTIIIVQSNENKSLFHYYGAESIVEAYEHALEALKNKNTACCHYERLTELADCLNKACSLPAAADTLPAEEVMAE